MKIKITRNRIKFVVTSIIGTATGTVVSQVLRNNMDEPENTFKKVEQKVGSYAIGALITGVVKDKTDRAIDKLCDFFEPEPETEIEEIESPPQDAE